MIIFTKKRTHSADNCFDSWVSLSDSVAVERLQHWDKCSSHSFWSENIAQPNIVNAHFLRRYRKPKCCIHDQNYHIEKWGWHELIAHLLFAHSGVWAILRAPRLIWRSIPPPTCGYLLKLEQSSKWVGSTWEVSNLIPSEGAIQAFTTRPAPWGCSFHLFALISVRRGRPLQIIFCPVLF